MSVPGVCCVCMCWAWGDVRNGNGEGDTCIFLTGPDDSIVILSWLKYESNFG